VASERLQLASKYAEEGDWRRVKLKVNQVIREYFPDEDLLEKDPDLLLDAISRLNLALKAKGL